MTASGTTRESTNSTSGLASQWKSYGRTTPLMISGNTWSLGMTKANYICSHLLKRIGICATYLLPVKLLLLHRI